MLIVTCWQITQHCTHLEKILCSMQDSLDQVSSWCDNNHMVINPIKTKSMTIATRQKHQLSPLPLDLVLNGATIDQVSEHRLLGITIDDQLRWNSHINNVCKTVSRRVFLLSSWRFELEIFPSRLPCGHPYRHEPFTKGIGHASPGSR